MHHLQFRLALSARCIAATGMVACLAASPVEAAPSIRTVALSGHHAPGTPDGVNFREYDFNAPVLNAAGQTAFIAFLTGSGVDSTNSSGIWSEGSGTLELVARSGSQAPGTPNGVNFNGSPSFFRPVLNTAGQTAFFAYLTSSSDNRTRGIWSEATGDLNLVARPRQSSSGHA